MNFVIKLFHANNIIDNHWGIVPYVVVISMVYTFMLLAFLEVCSMAVGKSVEQRKRHNKYPYLETVQLKESPYKKWDTNKTTKHHNHFVVATKCVNVHPLAISNIHQFTYRNTRSKLHSVAPCSTVQHTKWAHSFVAFCFLQTTWELSIFKWYLPI